MITSCKIALREIYMLIDAMVEAGTVWLLKEDGQRLPLSEDTDFVRLFEDIDAGPYIAVWLRGKWGFADRYSGCITVEPVWDYVGNFYDGLAEVCRGCAPVSEQERGFLHPEGGKWGCIGTDGEVIIPVEYDEIWYTGAADKSRIAVRENARYGCVSRDGTPTVPTVYDGMWFYPSVIVVEKEGLMGALDQYGIPLIPVAYERVIPIGDAAFICKAPRQGWSFFLHGKTAFSDVDSIWCYKNMFMDKENRVYMLLEKQGVFALACEDGRMLSDFSLIFRDAENLARNLIRPNVMFKKWLSLENGR